MRLTSFEVAVVWPHNRLPVEIFTIIIGNLPRSNIQNMRLVNKEFEEKVSEYLFRVVVVPFKPEIYGIAPEPALGLPVLTIARGGSTVMLQDKGMRVFQGFGRRIRKFAMSFEIDEAKLANPPIKNDQEAITSFWGLYRWPYQKYNRYHQLEGLEQTADETRTMAKALRFIESAKELGLSIDGGLGWLAGPDINRRAMERCQKYPVFGESRFVPEPPRPSNFDGFKSTLEAINDIESTYTDLSSRESTLYTTYERMLREAGYTGEDLDTSIWMLMETEDGLRERPTEEVPSEVNTHPLFTLANALGRSRSPSRAPRPRRSLREAAVASLVANAGTVATPAASQVDAQAAAHANERDHLDTEEESEDDGTAAALSSLRNLKNNKDQFSLKPNDLTNAQKEMLLEIEWAQRAFMQSYAIAIIDNPSTFQHIESLTIARLPNRHLPILRRDDFWDSLPQLAKLSLGIIPCWREVVKLPTSWVQDIRLTPSDSVSGVFRILQDQISPRENIKTLNFEWIGGGEEAPGIFARNLNILPAPFLVKARDMVDRPEATPLLSLPFVKHLSLKNCWFSPHILLKFGVLSRKDALQTLTLNSVSLTGPVPINAQPQPMAFHNQNLAHQALLNLAVGAPGQAVLNNQVVAQALLAANNAPPPPPPPQTSFATNDWLQNPRSGSWASVIELLTPGYTLALQRYLKHIGPEPPARNTGNLTKLEFNSCGYVKLSLDFPQPIEAPGDPRQNSSTINKRATELDPHMLKPYDDPYLGFIVNYMEPVEEQALENGFLLTVDWDTTIPERVFLAAEAKLDGALYPGRGRFQGVIEKE